MAEAGDRTIVDLMAALEQSIDDAKRARDRRVLREQLAAIEHERWAGWQKYLHSLCVRNADGSLTIPADRVAHRERQIATPYADLSEAEKESDRQEVDKYLPLVLGATTPEGGRDGEDNG